MRTLILITLLSTFAHADEIFLIEGKQVTKVEALTALVKDPNAKVQKLTDLKLSDKATLVKK